MSCKYTVLLTFCLLPLLCLASPSLIFNYQQGWLGADAAYSINLSKTKSLWLFGDSFINPSEPHATNRLGSKMIANSVALVDCQANQKCVVNYQWRGSQAEPKAFFESSTDKVEYWPRAGFYHNGKVYIFLLKFSRGGEGPFGFKTLGVDIATLTVTKSAINTWPLLIEPLANNQNLDILLGTAVAKKDGQLYLDKQHYLYLFANLNIPPSNPVILARVKAQPQPQWHKAEIYNNAGQWQKLVEVSDPKQIFSEGATEMSLIYDNSHNQWLTVYSLLNKQYIQASYAAALTGEWSEPKNFGKAYPIYQKDNKHYDPANVFCYAAKVTQLQALKPLLVSYVCNTFDPQLLYSNMWLYQPKLRWLAEPDTSEN